MSVTTTYRGGAASVRTAYATQPPPPAAPATLSATAISTTRIDLSWSSVAAVTSYNVYRITGTGTPNTLIDTVAAPTTTYSDTGLTNDTQYTYAVTAINGLGESAQSPTATATTPGLLPPDAPATLTATPTTTGVDLAWAASSGATSYTLQRSVYGSGLWADVVTQAGTSYSDAPGVGAYSYRVLASNAGGDSGYSPTASTLAAVSHWWDGLLASSLEQSAGVPAGVGDPVGVWTDRVAGVPATGTQRPNRSAAGLTFAGAQWLTHANVALANYTVLVVATNTGTPTSRYVIGGAPYSGMFFNDSTFAWFDATTVRYGSAIDGTAVWIASSAGTIWRNTTQIATGAALDAVTMTTIGRRHDGNYPFTGEIRGYALAPSALSDADLIAMSAWLSDYYSV